MAGGVTVDEYELIAQASQALEYGLHDAARKILRIIESGVWRDFVTPNGRRVTHERFADFVTATGLDGLNSDIRTVENVCRDNKRARDAVDQALQRPVGHPAIVDNGNDRPTGNTEAAALRRLRKDRPDLHAQVLNGELSAHAAAVEAGFRRRTISVPVDRPERIAAALRRHLSPEDLYEVLMLLGKP
jgi:hypothetical protein